MRGLACLFLILVATFAATPALLSSPSSSLATHAQSVPTARPDPTGSPYAINYTYSQADIYTKSKAIVTPNPSPLGASLNWFSTVNRTNAANTQIPGTDFNFTVTPGASPSRQEVNWTLTIPRFNCQSCNDEIVRFLFHGNLTKGTNATYALTYIQPNSTTIASQTIVTPGLFPSPNQIVIGCPTGRICIHVPKYVGFDLRLSFRFAWNATQKGLLVSVGELIVGSIGDYIGSTTHSMILNTSGNVVNHNATLLSIKYNSTVSYPNGLNPTQTIIHIWNNTILSIYYPAGYQISQANLNATSRLIYPLAAPEAPFQTATCNDDPICSQSLLALNVTDSALIGLISRNTTISITATTRNSISSLNLPTSYYVPGDQLNVTVSNRPSAANVSGTLRAGTLNLTVTDPSGPSKVVPAQTVSTFLGGVYTFTIPSNLLPSLLGTWRINATFNNGFDFGMNSTTFSIQRIIVEPGSFSYSGSNNQLALRGTLTYASSGSPPAGNLNATVFAADAGSGHGPLSTTNSSTAGLYISNITLVDAIFGPTEPLTIFFTVVNPTPAQGFNANITIEQEWSSGQTHGARANLNLTLGDQPFTFGPAIYRADILLLSSGMQITVTSIARQNQKAVTGSLGKPPLVPSRQHSGLFKVSIGSKALTGTASYYNSLESPTYAYLSSQAAGALLPSSLLTSKTFLTATDGSFSVTLNSNRILAAKKLVFLVLARDANGIVLGNQDPTATSPDSTILQSNTAQPGQLAVGQQATITLHLNNTSLKIFMNIDISLIIQGVGTVATQSALDIPPGPRDVSFTFTAPSSPGTYQIIFSSAQYGAPLAAATLQVSVVPSTLQILIPSIVGLVAAIVIIGYYMVRRKPEKTQPSLGKEKPSSGKPAKSTNNIFSSKPLT